MALTDTPWCGDTADKLYLQSGQFTSTVKTSQGVVGIDSTVVGIEWDGINTPWAGKQANKLYLQSGQFTSTLKTSEDITAIDNISSGISHDTTNTPWCGSEANKLYLQSGQFTSTVKTSASVNGVDTDIQDISYDGTNTPWTGTQADKLYLQSGQFTSTVKTSASITTIDTHPTGISHDGTNTPWCGDAGNKLYLQSGQFTSTMKTSELIGGIDGEVWGISTNDVNSRLDIVIDITVTPSELTISATQQVPASITHYETVTPSVLILTGTLPIPTFTGVEVVFAATELSLSGSLNAPVFISDVNMSVESLSLSATQNSTAIIAGSSVFIIMNAALALSATQGVITISGDAILLLPDQSMIVLESALSLHAPSINVTNDVRIIVTNTRNFAISEYTGFAFNSMCRFNGRYLYARSDGIYEGGGSDDDGEQISASYKTGAIDVYTTEIQRLRDAYLNFRSDGDVQLFSVGDEINPRAYTVTGAPAAVIHERRVKFERGIKDRHFNFGISNINGSTLEVDSIKVLTEPVRKRR